MPGPVAIWNGTEDEMMLLVEIIAANCAIHDHPTQPHPADCASHSLLKQEGAQRRLDTLLFNRRIKNRLILEEYKVTPRLRALRSPR